jgi:plastocyanin
MIRPALVALLLAGVCACSSSSSGSTDGPGGASGAGGSGGAGGAANGVGGAGGGGGSANGVGGSAGGGGSTGGSSVNGCTTFVDQTADTDARKMVWDFSVSSDPNRCMTIKKGQTVAFEGNFTTHPLVAAGGDSPNPFSSVPATGKVTFDATGTFGFVCSVHASMNGAIQVVE